MSEDRRSSAFFSVNLHSRSSGFPIVNPLMPGAVPGRHSRKPETDRKEPGSDVRSADATSDPATHRAKPDLSLAARCRQRLRSISDATTTAVVVQHTVRTTLGHVRPAAARPRRSSAARPVVEALREAVAELRAIDLTYGPGAPDSLVSRLRRDEISRRLVPAAGRPGGPVRRDAGGHRRLVRRLGGARRLRPGRAARRAGRSNAPPTGCAPPGSHDYAVRRRRRPGRRGRAPHGGPWRVAVHHPAGARRAPRWCWR